MTSAQFMQTRRSRLRARCVRSRWRGSALLLLAALAACSAEPKLAAPSRLYSPYERTALWAVVPFNNESGVSAVDPARVADLFAEQVEQVQGLSATPVNRVMMAMRRLELHSINNAAEARTLMNLLGADGLIVGTITAYDPYDPPKFGAAIQLFRGPASPESSSLDPVEIMRSRTEIVALGQLSASQSVSQASGVFDAHDQQVLMWLQDYATGRTEPGAPHGWRIHLVNMELYTQFAAYRLLHDLLDHERSMHTASAALEPPR